MAELTTREGAHELFFRMPDGTREKYTLNQLYEMPTGILLNLVNFLEGGRLEDHHDFVMIVGGTAFTIGYTVDVFRNGISQGGVVWNTQAAYTKTRWHTSLNDRGGFGYDTFAFIVQAELIAIPPPAKAATVGSSASVGQVTDSSDHATQPTGYNPAHYLKALLFQSSWVFQWGEQDLDEDGLLLDLPGSVGLSGHGGGPTHGIVQNSLFASSPRGLREPKIVRPDETFFIRFRADSILANPVDFPMLARIKAFETGQRPT